MSVQQKISFGLFLLIGLGFIFSGVTYTFSGTVQSYHLDAIGKTWQQIGTGQQLVLVAIMRGSGSGTLAAGFSILAVLLMAFRKKEMWSMILLFSVAVIKGATAVFTNLQIRQSTEGNPPLAITIAVVVASVIGVVLFLTDRQSKNTRQDSPASVKTTTVQKLAATPFFVIGLGFLILGFLYTFSSSIQPYHLDAVGKTWAEIPQNEQLVFLGLMRGSGTGFIAAGIDVMLLLKFPFSRRETWAAITIFMIALLQGIPTIYSVIQIHQNTQGRPPLLLAVLIVVFALIGLVLSFLFNRPNRPDRGQSHE